MAFFKNRYRTETIRLKNWDYHSPAYYFVTVCIKNRECFFGDVADGEVKLSPIGEIASRYWQEIPNHFPHVQLDEYIVLPNHVHGIIIIDNNIVETQNFASLRGKPSKFGPQSRNLASIIRGYKIGVKKWSVINNILFAWQQRCYEHIIRNEKELHNISEYIANNLINWVDDEENLDYIKK